MTTVPSRAAAPKRSPEQTGAGLMRALVKHHAAEGLEYTDARPVPEPGPREVRIKVTKAGICGTDRHIWQWDDWASSRVPLGTVTGHEFVGTIDKLGEAVTGLGVGQRVSAEGHLHSGNDYNARTGNAHIATDTRIFGIDCDGCFADCIVVPEQNVWPVHEAISDDIAAVFDPLGNAVHTVMEAGVSAKTVLISGVGIIGLMAVTVARAAGAARIYCTDVNPPRLALARKLGAHEAFDAREGDNWIKTIRNETAGEGVDVLLEMSGAPTAMDQGFRTLRNGGRAALLGLPARDVAFDFNSNIIFKGCTVLGINGRRIWETWYQTEKLLVGGRLDLGDIITHTFPLADYEKAFQTMISGEGIKVLLDINA
ncbi:MAG: L-threonine 3-dehydrogenase [Planctomycetota bacterium]